MPLNRWWRGDTPREPEARRETAIEIETRATGTLVITDEASAITEDYWYRRLWEAQRRADEIEIANRNTFTVPYNTQAGSIYSVPITYISNEWISTPKRKKKSHLPKWF